MTNEIGDDPDICGYRLPTPQGETEDLVERLRAGMGSIAVRELCHEAASALEQLSEERDVVSDHVLTFGRRLNEAQARIEALSAERDDLQMESDRRWKVEQDLLQAKARIAELEKVNLWAESKMGRRIERLEGALKTIEKAMTIGVGYSAYGPEDVRELARASLKEQDNVEDT
jgi:chromosome segregation ATPase